jgi:hypothetical protein
MYSPRRFGSRATPEQAAIKHLIKSSMDKPLTGLPDARKRPHAFGAPSISEFQAAISRHRGSGVKVKPHGPRAKK